MRVGVEVGGTFTDLVALDGDAMTVTKVPSVRARPEEGALAALTAAGLDLGRVGEIVHGSTVATNAVLERRGGRIAFVATGGFEDILFLQRHDRLRIYDLFYRKPLPVVGRADVVGVAERIGSDGSVITPLDEAAAEAALVDHLAGRSVDAVAVCLLNAYINPDHERRIRAILEARFPGLPVTLSSEISGEFREYERASTTTLAAYVQPVVASYLGRFEAALRERGFTGRFSVMQSNGGSAPVAAMSRNAINALLSGPAAGVVGAVRQVELSGFANVMTLDIGGTSADVCLVSGGQPTLSPQSVIDGLPVQTPMLDVNTIGAGGGSIIFVDDGGMLRVGPESAGAVPGPAAYGRGGERPTLTDAHVVRGVIRDGAKLAGGMALDVAAARRALEGVAASLGKPVEELAENAVRIANANIVGALRIVSTERGRDPRDYVLVPYGGAGPLHAAEIAEDLGVATVVVPPSAGVVSAFGLLVSDKIHFETLTRRIPLDAAAPDAVREVAGALRARTEAYFGELGVTGPAAWDLILDMRLVGQAFEISVPVAGDALEGLTEAALTEAFHQAHEEAYSYRSGAGKRVEIVSVRLGARVPGTGRGAALGAAAADAVAAVEREVMLRDGPTTCRFLARAALAPGEGVAGAAVIEDPTSTTLVPPGWTATVDAAANLVLRRQR